MNNKTGQNYKKGTYFEVENILKDIIENGKRKFLVKWKNYSDSWNGWVEEEDMSCPNMISEYESKKRTQLKRKIEETDELGLSSKRRKNQEVIIVLFVHCSSLSLIVNIRSHSEYFSYSFRFLGFD